MCGCCGHCGGSLRQMQEMLSSVVLIVPVGRIATSNDCEMELLRSIQPDVVDDNCRGRRLTTTILDG
jgi:hypothetical protein